MVSVLQTSTIVTIGYIGALFVLRIMQDYHMHTDSAVLSAALHTSNHLYRQARASSHPVERIHLASMAYANLMMCLNHRWSIPHELEYAAGFDLHRRKKRLEHTIETESGRLRALVPKTH